MGENQPDNLNMGDSLGPDLEGGITVYYEDDPFTVDPQTTAGELKDQIGCAEGDRLTYDEESEDHGVKDDARVVDHVPDGAKIRFQPVGRADLFG